MSTRQSEEQQSPGGMAQPSKEISKEGAICMNFWRLLGEHTTTEVAIQQLAGGGRLRAKGKNKHSA